MLPLDQLEGSTLRSAGILRKVTKRLFKGELQANRIPKLKQKSIFESSILTAQKSISATRKAHVVFFEKKRQELKKVSLIQWIFDALNPWSLENVTGLCPHESKSRPLGPSVRHVFIAIFFRDSSFKKTKNHHHKINSKKKQQRSVLNSGWPNVFCLKTIHQRFPQNRIGCKSPQGWISRPFQGFSKPRCEKLLSTILLGRNSAWQTNCGPAVTRTGVQLETAAAYGQKKVTTQRGPFTENGAQRFH